MGNDCFRRHQRLSYCNFRIPNPQDNMLALTSMFAVSSGSLGIHLQDIPNQSFRFKVNIEF